MSIFGTIMSKVFGHHADAAPAPTPAGGAAPAPSPSGSAATAPAPSGEAAPPSGGAAAAPASVDVTAILDGMDGKAGQKLDWRHSIVDLMKLLGMDSSLTARKELAGELHYSGDTSDSAAMNIWLHKEVMKKFAENGGKLPPDLH